VIRDGLRWGKNSLEIEVDSVYHSNPAEIIAKKSKKMPVSLALEGFCRLPTASESSVGDPKAAVAPSARGVSGAK
jgi:hypothetical protein